MADHDDDTDDSTQDDGSALVKDLRRQLKQANKELGELRPFRDQRVLQQAGFDPDSKTGKALLRLHDGDLTAEALQATAEEYGFEANANTTSGDEPVDEVAAQRTEATKRIDDLRANAQPVGSQKMSADDLKQLQQLNPAAAAQALAKGQADLPPFVAAAIEANRAERAQQMGA